MTEVQNRALSASVTSQVSQAHDPSGRWWTHSVNSTVLPAPASAATRVTGWLLDEPVERRHGLGAPARPSAEAWAVRTW